MDFLATFLRAFENLDLDEFIGHFDADAHAFFPEATSPRRAIGVAAIRAHFEMVFTAMRKDAPTGPPYHRLVANDVEVQRLGKDLGVVSFHLDGTRIGRRTLVLAHDEHWRVVHLHASNITVEGV